MTIDLGSAIIGVIIVIIATLPFVMMSRSKTKKEKKLHQKLVDLALQKSSKINNYQALQHLAIGLDTDNHYVFFCDTQDQISIENTVDLSKIKQVNLIKDKENKKDSQKIKRVGLRFIPMSKDDKAEFFEFFNDDKNPQVFREIQMAEKWVDILQKQLIKA